MTVDSNNQPARPNRKEGKANDYATKSKDENDSLALCGDTSFGAVRRRSGADNGGQSGFGDGLGRGRAEQRIGGGWRGGGGGRPRAGGGGGGGGHRAAEGGGGWRRSTPRRRGSG